MNRTRRFLSGAVAAAFALTAASSHEKGFAAGRATDRPATHNMLVVGEDTVYLSHLPMFQEKGNPPMPHRYQAILEASFERQQDYAKDRRDHLMTTIYTLNPEVFVLPDLIAAEPGRVPLRTFQANAVFRGHLERPGSASILRNVGVSVKRVVHFHEFDPKAVKRPQLEYILFGKGQELFLAHLIAAPADFDQMLAVKISGVQPGDEDLSKGLTVLFAQLKNTPATRLKASQHAAGKVTLRDAATGKDIQVDVTRELYFEQGELRVPPVFETTTEEKRAGFP